jgi:hypothetical protein
VFHLILLILALPVYGSANKVASCLALHGVIHIRYLGDKFWLILQTAKLNNGVNHAISRNNVAISCACGSLRLR